MNNLDNKYRIETDKKNKVTIEKVSPNEINEIWSRLQDLNKTF